MTTTPNREWQRFADNGGMILFVDDVPTGAVHFTAHGWKSSIVDADGDGAIVLDYAELASYPGARR